MTSDEGLQKVRRTIGWYNHNGNLGSQIVYRDVAPYIEAINPKEALKILASLEEKGKEIRNPTAWIKSAAEAVGPDLDPRVKKTIAWWNKHGGLTEEIRYDEVRGPLAFLPLAQQLEILGSLEGKAESIQKPSAWIVGAARRASDKIANEGPMAWEPTWDEPWGHGDMGGYGASSYGGYSHAQQQPWSQPQGDDKVKRTIGWYNRSGVLQQPIHYDTVGPALAAVGPKAALEILSGLESKGSEIRDPSQWIIGACRRVVGH